MCSFFGVEMENYQGDLTDIIRAGGRQIGSNNSASVSASSSSASVVSASDHLNNPLPTWQFPSDPLSFCSSIDDNRENLFGDPFSNTRDPLLHELNIPNSSGYYAPPPLPPADRVVDHEAATAASNINIGRRHHHQRGLFHEDELKSPCNIFSRIQISPSSQSPKQQPAVSPCESPVIAAAASPRGIKTPVVVASDMINANSTSKSCLVDNTGPAQISSPRNLGIKRRSDLLFKFFFTCCLHELTKNKLDYYYYYLFIIKVLLDPGGLLNVAMMPAVFREIMKFVVFS